MMRLFRGGIPDSLPLDSHSGSPSASPWDSGKVRWLYVLLVATCFPIFHNLARGQVSLLLVACVLCAFDALLAKRRLLGGCFLAFAAAIKFYPVLFVVYFLLIRDVRTLAAFCLAGLLFFAVLPSFALGVFDWVQFEVASREAVSEASSWIAHDSNSQYITHVGLRYAAWLFPSADQGLLAQVLTVLGFTVAAFNIILVWRLHRRRISDETALALVALFLAQPFVIPTSWPHYFSYLPFCQAFLLGSLYRDWPSNSSSSILFTLTVLSAIASTTFLFNSFPHWSFYNGYSFLFFANMLLIPPLYGLSWRKLRATEQSTEADVNKQSDPGQPQDTVTFSTSS